MRIILHVDMDAFFTSIEERERPELKGKPVIVGADPKGGRGRGVVSTANYEARKFGIHSALPISMAYQLNPKAVFLTPNFELYVRSSQNIMEILKSHADKMEVAGLDEAYIDISGQVKSFEEAKVKALKIKSDILKAEKINCSIGVSPNKVVSKIASDFKKPNGLTIVTPEKVENFLSPLPVEKIPGIGPKSKEKLNNIGVKTVKDLRNLSSTVLQQHFGKWGTWMYDLARGIDESPLIEHWEPKSASREHTFEYDIKDSNIIFDALRKLTESVCKELKEEELVGKTITIKIRYQGFETHTKQKTLKVSTNDPEVVYGAAEKLLEPFLLDKRKIRLIGVRVSKFN
ncbi:DNA polymerase IV [Candidatus Margulisiibacteriota bacterium]